MPREWLTDEQRRKVRAREKWTRIEAWAFGFGLAALTLIGLRELFRW